jgi:hypothetical protein
MNFFVSELFLKVLSGWCLKKSTSQTEILQEIGHQSCVFRPD